MSTPEKKIATYRNLSEQEVELMNELKKLESDMLNKLEEIGAMRQAQKDYLTDTTTFGDDIEGLIMKQLNESHKYLEEAVRNIQQGSMWAVRSIALPTKI